MIWPHSENIQVLNRFFGEKIQSTRTRKLGRQCSIQQQQQQQQKKETKIVHCKYLCVSECCPFECCDKIGICKKRDLCVQMCITFGQHG